MKLKMPNWRDCKTDADRRAYHTQTYAWRILRNFAMPGTTTSPVDPNGEWYDAEAVALELARMRNHTKRKSSTHDADKGRDIVNKWAKKQGFADMDDYTRAKFGDPGDPADSNANWFKAYEIYLAEFKAEVNARAANRVPLLLSEQMSEAAKQRLRDKSILRQAQEELGISATESESKP